MRYSVKKKKYIYNNNNNITFRQQFEEPGTNLMFHRSDCLHTYLPTSPENNELISALLLTESNTSNCPTIDNMVGQVYNDHPLTFCAVAHASLGGLQVVDEVVPAVAHRDGDAEEAAVLCAAKEELPRGTG